ncbi:MAG: co-chaperone GroES [Patescibacteria group bacterium]|nr:co-chaperone GroES [Patescibacteria group bacterium]MDE1967009.1 co-chaperone GroES [Patescibacteria group bacterium]
MKDISKKIKPLGDRVLIKEDAESKEKKTSAGIIIPVTVNDDKGGKRGVVVAIGPGKTESDKNGKPVLAPISVKAGDKVIFQWGDKIKIDDEEYYIVREPEILAIIK